MNRICRTAFAAATLIAAATSSGAVNYSSQARSVVAERSFGGNVFSQTFSAPDFFAFNQTAIENDFPNLNTGNATATQNSGLGQTEIRNVTSVAANDGNQGSFGRAKSFFTTTFTVDVPTPWELSGSWVFSSNNLPTGPAHGTLVASLVEQGGGTLYSLNYDSWTGPIDPAAISGVFNGAGTLVPGQNYIFTLNITEEMNGLPGNFLGTGSFDATLSFVPAPSAAALLGLGGLIAGRRRRG